MITVIAIGIACLEAGLLIGMCVVLCTAACSLDGIERNVKQVLYELRIGKNKG